MNLETKTNLRRVEVLQMLSEINLKLKTKLELQKRETETLTQRAKLRGIVLELFKKLKYIDIIYNLALPVKINILLG